MIKRITTNTILVALAILLIALNITLITTRKIPHSQTSTTSTNQNTTDANTVSGIYEVLFSKLESTLSKYKIAGSVQKIEKRPYYHAGLEQLTTVGHFYFASSEVYQAAGLLYDSGTPHAMEICSSLEQKLLSLGYENQSQDCARAIDNAVVLGTIFPVIYYNDQIVCNIGGSLFSCASKSDFATSLLAIEPFYEQLMGQEGAYEYSRFDAPKIEKSLVPPYEWATMSSNPSCWDGCLKSGETTTHIFWRQSEAVPWTLLTSISGLSQYPSCSIFDTPTLQNAFSGSTCLIDGEYDKETILQPSSPNQS